jgi:hypothetical protein
MPLDKKPVSCTPCAKRKVRSDILQPCCHCKRRKQDTCIYPEFGSYSGQHIREQAKRIERLEEYVRVLGADPNESNVGARLESTYVDKPHEQQMSAIISTPTNRVELALVRRTQRPTQKILGMSERQ